MPKRGRGRRGAGVPEVTWIAPGEAAARAALDGPQGFLTPARLAKYADKRNDPTVPQVRALGRGTPRPAGLHLSRPERGP